MAQYAIAFDLNTVAMRANGLSQAQIVTIYQQEIPKALAACDFTVHAQGSLYHTDLEQDQITALMRLQSTLKRLAPSFCRYVERVHVFRMEEWSDVTLLLANHPANPTIDPLDEIEENDFARNA